MKAAVIDRYGPNERVQIRDIAVPAIGPMDLLVRVRAASVNPLDVKTRDGALKMLLKYQFPLVLGNDMAGEVTDVGAQVTRFKKGDAVSEKTDRADQERELPERRVRTIGGRHHIVENRASLGTRLLSRVMPARPARRTRCLAHRGVFGSVDRST